MAWNFGTVASAVAAAVRPDKPALIHGDRTVTWSEFDTLTDNLAAQMMAAGLKPGDIVGHYMRNGPGYLISFIACCKAGLTHVNINFHYKEEELR
ncbi:MAG: AMP-binding protein, partial [Pseudomonadota bacterium]